MTASQQKRRKKCRGCGKWFRPYNSMQKAAPGHIQCAQNVVRADREKRERRETRQQRQKLKTRSEWQRETQEIFNAYIRERDKNRPCISCSRFHDGQWHAGHYRTVGAHPELRFCETNVHRQCAPCNNHKSGDIINYRKNLVERIGKEAVEWLEGPHEPRKYTIDELKKIKQLYRDKLKARRNKRDD